jgi:rhodanese-related sulfurtransferase
MKNRLYLLAALLLMLGGCTANSQGIKPINSTEVSELLQANKSLIILDVRTPEEYAQGHIKGAVNLDVHQPDAMDKIDKLDKNATYLVYCRTKNRSGVVANHMNDSGFKTVYQMMDGITGWNANLLPVEK